MNRYKWDADATFQCIIGGTCERRYIACVSTFLARWTLPAEEATAVLGRIVNSSILLVLYLAPSLYRMMADIDRKNHRRRGAISLFIIEKAESSWR